VLCILALVYLAYVRTYVRARRSEARRRGCDKNGEEQLHEEKKIPRSVISDTSQPASQLVATTARRYPASESPTKTSKRPAKQSVAPVKKKKRRKRRRREEQRRCVKREREREREREISCEGVRTSKLGGQQRDQRAASSDI